MEKPSRVIDREFEFQTVIREMSKTRVASESNKISYTRSLDRHKSHYVGNELDDGFWERESHFSTMGTLPKLSCYELNAIVSRRTGQIENGASTSLSEDDIATGNSSCAIAFKEIFDDRIGKLAVRRWIDGEYKCIPISKLHKGFF